ncbi:peptidase inhibitor family I36 protein [Actinomadura soli]|nr:peptidase inhibitor family I36 protein [Actinomadura soli]
MKRSLGRAALALALAASATALSASPASATTPNDFPDCPKHSLCAWSESDFKGKVTTFRPGGGCFDTPFPIRSGANTFPYGGGIDVILVIYTGKGCTGELLVNLSRGAYKDSLPAEGLSAESAW